MKKITSLFITLILFFTLVGCSNSSSNSELVTTPNLGLLLSPGTVCEFNAGPTGSFSYEVIPSYKGDKLSVVDEAEYLVREWWNDDSTFRTPEIIWVTVLSGNIRGFQDTGYLFLDPNTSYEDILATAVHEWLHELVDPATLIDLETGWARPVMEYVVESITIDLLEGVAEVAPSYYYSNLKGSMLSKHLPKLQKAFRAEKSVEAYEEIFGQDYKTILGQIIIENA